ncbi:helix-turn-helix domain-containing protein [Puia dinghuensis]|uniref:AraC family transcriptional regulator n=1 Tax=Puia dinghuensis TaxID=1792502 RepID=A0A8J2UDT4_9BACT|nr:AraC family transcriptional regulator [Puia dinghuensis]GGB01335.1 AraC family transcriptional regulator [Puia dinghuensis]
MPQKSMPVYDIDDFKYLGLEDNFYANTFREHLTQHSHIILAPHRHTFYLCVLFTCGKGVHEIDFHKYDIRPGSVFLLFPGQVHNWRVSDDTDGYILFHKKEFYNMNFIHEKVEHFPFFNCIQNAPLLRLKPQQVDTIEPVFKEIVEEYRSQELMRMQKIGSLLNVLYIDLSRMYIPSDLRATKIETQLAHVRRLEKLIDDHFRETKSPAKYAEMMFMSEKNLNRVCKSCLAKTVSEVISDKIMVEAKRMLIYSELTVAQVATELGYLDNSYFTRMFKRKTGLTPLEFQKTYRNNLERKSG